MLQHMRLLFRLIILVAVVLALIQLIPYGRDHSNPVTVQELKWNAPATRVLAQNACFACHSNLTTWPWYTKVAPLSWLTAHDVEAGRAKLNFSEWQRPQEADLQQVVDALQGKSMPPLEYRLLHKEARLTDSQRQQLLGGLVASWTADPPGHKQSP